MKGAADKTATLMRAVFASRNLTLHQVSVQSELLYGTGSPFCIPHTLYHSLESSRRFGPSLLQTCALSRITNYRIADWLAVLGIDPDRIASLEASLPLRRTRLVDTAFGRSDFMVCEAGRRPLPARPGGAVPVGWLLGSGKQVSRTSDIGEKQHSHFARIGAEDAFAFPELVPGSIVRVIPTKIPECDFDGSGPPRLLLIEHEQGLCCARFHVSGGEIIHAATSELSYAPITFQIPREARILGTVDMEIRWMHRFENPHVPAEFATYRQPRTLNRTSSGPGALVRRARARAGLTLGEASRLSRRISFTLGNQQYAIAESTLSEYEAQDLPPRHLEKVITLCLVYGIGLADFVAASETPSELLGNEAIPAHLLPESHNALADGCQQRLAGCDDPGDCVPLLPHPGDLPWFLQTALADLSGIQRPSVRDFFLLSGDQPFLPPHTQGSWLALVNRRKRKPVRLPSRTSWQQPAYLLLLRNGEYQCACCSAERENLVLYPASDSRRVPEQLRLGRDVEVVGQIVALARFIA